MNLEELVDLMQDEMHDAHQEIEKFMDGNKSAGTRARKSCLLYTSPSPRDQRGSSIAWSC